MQIKPMHFNNAFVFILFLPRITTKIYCILMLYFFDSVPQCRYHQDFVHIDRGYSGFLHEQKESLYPFCARGKTTDADHPAGVTVRNWSVIF